MGLTHVTTTVRKLAGRGKGFAAEFLVDTGAVDSLAPAKALRKTGIKPEGKNVYEQVDGSPVELEYGFARISLMGGNRHTHHLRPRGIRADSRRAGPGGTGDLRGSQDAFFETGACQIAEAGSPMIVVGPRPKTQSADPPQDQLGVLLADGESEQTSLSARPDVERAERRSTGYRSSFGMPLLYVP
jgi:hypothetical protein